MAVISATIDDTAKRLFEGICNSIGVDVPTALRVFVKATIRENGLPFSLKAVDDPYIYSEENMTYLRQGIAQIEAGNGQFHELRKIL